MRIKSEAKRQQIIEVATEVFRENGFSRSSMAEICAKVGGSKATLYNHFSSKEELFFEVMYRTTEAEFKATHDALNPDADDIAQTLKEFGQKLLTLLYSPRVMSIRRLLVAEMPHTDIGAVCYERGPKKTLELVGNCLRRAMEKGQIRKTDPKIATLHYRGLLEAEVWDRLLFVPGPPLTQTEACGIAERSVDVFMRAYAPD